MEWFVNLANPTVGCKAGEFFREQVGKDFDADWWLEWRRVEAKDMATARLVGKTLKKIAADGGDISLHPRAVEVIEASHVLPKCAIRAESVDDDVLDAAIRRALTAKPEIQEQVLDALTGYPSGERYESARGNFFAMLEEAGFQTVPGEPVVWPTAHTAPDYLNQASRAIADRAASRDHAEGERSMLRTVEAFNAIYGTNLTEPQGWQFMALLKIVRGSQGEFRADDFIDEAAYAALAGEASNPDNHPGANDNAEK